MNVGMFLTVTLVTVRSVCCEFINRCRNVVFCANVIACAQFLLED